MIAKTGKYTDQELLEIEGGSWNDKDKLLTKLTLKNVGSSYYEVDTKNMFTLNTEEDDITLKWYPM